jgi:hypothetical protein
VFDSADEAIAACKKIVDDCLEPMFGMTVMPLCGRCSGLVLICLIGPLDPNAAPVALSAWSYAMQRCEVLGEKPLRG